MHVGMLAPEPLALNISARPEVPNNRPLFRELGARPATFALVGEQSRAALRGLSVGLVVGLIAPLVAPESWRSGETPAAAPVRAHEPEGARASEDVLLRLLLRAESLLRLGHGDSAVEMLAGLSVDGHHADDLLRLQSWAFFETGRFGPLAELLAGEERLSSELRYLRGAARWRSGGPGALDDLRALWWQEPATVWGLAALRELASLSIAEGGAYPDAHRERILALVAPPDLDGALDAAQDIESALSQLANAHRDPGLLAAELHHAWGVLLLAREEFTQAANAFRKALYRQPPAQLYRSIELNLAETLRRRGNYDFAMQRFERVAQSGDDALADRALASAGQMAIQNRRYEEARAHFESALVRNPVGGARHRALWGLGWVAFRTGDFISAIRFFQTLELEAPYDPLTPRARYWRARSHEERRELEVARALMVALTEQFPVDYYAYRAAEWLGSKRLRDATYPQNPSSDHPRVTAAASLFRAGMPVRATRALRAALGAADELGPHELLRLEAMAYELQADRIAKRLRLERQHRFPLGEQARASLRKVYPDEAVKRLEEAGRRARVSPELLVAVARRESGFNPRALSSVGAVGLLQLMPATAADLLEEEGGHLGGPQQLMDPDTNARLGARYLGRMLRAFRGRKEYALAAYNAGPGAVTRWREARGDLPDDIFVEEIPYRETRHYVRAVLSALRAFELATSEVPVDALPTGYDEMLAVSLPAAPP